ncbi:hypothetical protein QBC37DRAFT_408408 [Rhypophila decipiens]|uniref:Uncharacterized protein n=1 Tax=Rhypophila decipiens TaxID=261697 RepID=A0AAN6YKU1_9PEZI|nr:hypothetical protein QBC37DRAFT_408408 [Rhypophila decipiens]
MSASSPTAILRNGLRLLFPLAVILTTYLYLYPVFKTCAFPLPPDHDGGSADTGHGAYIETAKLHWPSNKPTAKDTTAADHDRTETRSSPAPPSRLAPFRLLSLGDPQLEGATSIPTNYLGVFPHVSSLIKHVTFQSQHNSLRERARESLHDMIDILFDDVFFYFESLRKRLDHFGNDFYLAHQYRTLRWWTRPTHVTVLGDLVGSQWLDDDEFNLRADRYWSRVFRGGERVPDDVATYPADEYDLTGYLGGGDGGDDSLDGSGVWTRRIINVAGNHDIGYAGDINTERTERFERAFGKINYELRFELPLNRTRSRTAAIAEDQPDRLIPELRIVVLNDMNLDTPALSSELQDATYSFINKVIGTSTAVEFRGHYTVILTHVPLYKPEGICVDDPLFNFHDHDGTLKEQNQLSRDASKGFLEGMLGMSGDVNAPGRGRGRPGIILNGHDHEGCDTWHFINQSDPEAGQQREWEVKRWRQARKSGLVGREGLPGVREITVRSMMGEFGGNAGLLSMWFDETSWEWKAEYDSCPMGTQHLWWFVHFLDLGIVIAAVVYVFVLLLNGVGVDVDGAVMRALPSCLTGGRAKESKQLQIPVGKEAVLEEKKPLKEVG